MSRQVYYPTTSARMIFDDPDRMAAMVPGGHFGILPLEPGPFSGEIRITELGPGVSVRSVTMRQAVAIRSEFSSVRQNVAYILPSLGGGTALFDGREAHHRSLITRVAGQTPSLRTFGEYEIGALAIVEGALINASEALTGHPNKALLTAPSTNLNAVPSHVERLRALHRSAVEMLTHYAPAELAEDSLPALSVLRDELLSTLVTGLTEQPLKLDHRARQLQTASMAKIDRYLDECSEAVIGLQDLCLAISLPIRTVETIVRSRTGMPALAYLRRRRLASARRLLMEPNSDTSVTSAALMGGFWHLGRFAAYYRQVYGEPPSRTLARSSGR